MMSSVDEDELTVIALAGNGNSMDKVSSNDECGENRERKHCEEGREQTQIVDVTLASEVGDPNNKKRVQYVATANQGKEETRIHNDNVVVSKADALDEDRAIQHPFAINQGVGDRCRHNQDSVSETSLMEEDHTESDFSSGIFASENSAANNLKDCRGYGNDGKGPQPEGNNDTEESCQQVSSPSCNAVMCSVSHSPVNQHRKAGDGVEIHSTDCPDTEQSEESTLGHAVCGNIRHNNKNLAEIKNSPFLPSHQTKTQALTGPDGNSDEVYLHNSSTEYFEPQTLEGKTTDTKATKTQKCVRFGGETILSVSDFFPIARRSDRSTKTNAISAGKPSGTRGPTRYTTSQGENTDSTRTVASQVENRPIIKSAQRTNKSIIVQPSKHAHTQTTASFYRSDKCTQCDYDYEPLDDSISRCQQSHTSDCYSLSVPEKEVSVVDLIFHLGENEAIIVEHESTELTAAAGTALDAMNGVCTVEPHEEDDSPVQIVRSTCRGVNPAPKNTVSTMKINKTSKARHAKSNMEIAMRERELGHVPRTIENAVFPPVVNESLKFGRRMHAGDDNVKKSNQIGQQARDNLRPEQAIKTFDLRKTGKPKSKKSIHDLGPMSIRPITSSSLDRNHVRGNDRLIRRKSMHNIVCRDTRQKRDFLLSNSLDALKETFPFVEGSNGSLHSSGEAEKENGKYKKSDDSCWWREPLVRNSFGDHEGGKGSNRQRSPITVRGKSRSTVREKSAHRVNHTKSSHEEVAVDVRKRRTKKETRHVAFTSLPDLKRQSTFSYTEPRPSIFPNIFRVENATQTSCSDCSSTKKSVLVQESTYTPSKGAEDKDATENRREMMRDSLATIITDTLSMCPAPMRNQRHQTYGEDEGGARTFSVPQTEASRKYLGICLSLKGLTGSLWSNDCCSSGSSSTPSLDKIAKPKRPLEFDFKEKLKVNEFDSTMVLVYESENKPVQCDKPSRVKELFGKVCLKSPVTGRENKTTTGKRHSSFDLSPRQVPTTKMKSRSQCATINHHYNTLRPIQTKKLKPSTSFVMKNKTNLKRTISPARACVLPTPIVKSRNSKTHKTGKEA